MHIPPEFVVIAIVAIVAGSLFSVLKIWLKRPGQAAVPQAELKDIRDGLSRMEQAIDAIAIEVETALRGPALHDEATR
jgi:hypothetical protein